jgi:uncharacterized repeat protein (TIGR03803 family)
MKNYYLTLLLQLTILFVNGQSSIMGVTVFGGEDQYGTIFSTDSAGSNFQVNKSFPFIRGALPKSGLTDFNNKLYGAVYDGLYEYDYTSDEYTYLVTFIDSIHGRDTYSRPELSSSGMFYGTTSLGGPYGCGCLYKYDPGLNQVQTIFAFRDSTGCNQKGNLLFASNSKLYGMTSNGGSNGVGVLFEYDETTNNYKVLYHFKYNTTGANPLGGLVEGSNNDLWGVTSDGGLGGDGTLFKYYINSDTLIRVHTFSSAGTTPVGDLVWSNNKLFGLTQNGGTYAGTLYEFDTTTSAIVTHHNFISSTGYSPAGGLHVAPNGKLYGTARLGGISNTNGVLFEFDAGTNTYSVVHYFDGSSSQPTTTPMVASNGKMYFTIQNFGLIEYDFNTTPVKLFDFGKPRFGQPNSPLMQTVLGKVYGVSRHGGDYNDGVLYEFDPSNNRLYNRHSFEGDPPYGRLVEAPNGELYGIGGPGVVSNDDYLYSYNPAIDSIEIRVTFNITAASAEDPNGDLILMPNGKLLGTTRIGPSINGVGTIFEYDPSIHQYNPKLGLTFRPTGCLLSASNGNFYGLNETSPNGAIFEYNYNLNSITGSANFGLSNGKWPVGSMVEVPGGKIYGLTTNGGNSNSEGVLFEYDNTNHTIIKKVELDSITGTHPQDGLTLGANGKVYGVTKDGGMNSYGTLFEYDPVNDQFTVLKNLSPTTGITAIFRPLAYHQNLNTNLSTIMPENPVTVFPNPVANTIQIKSLNKIVKVVLTDIQGKIIFTVGANDNELLIAMDKLKQGNYLMNIYSTEAYVRKKVVVVK